MNSLASLCKLPLACFLFVASNALATDEVHQALIAFSKSVNKNLPLQIDKEKTLEATVAFRSTLIFKYKFTDESTIRNPRFSRSEYEKHLRASLRASTCPDPGVTELMKRGAQFNYLFLDSRGSKVIDFTLNLSSCAQ